MFTDMNKKPCGNSLYLENLNGKRNGSTPISIIFPALNHKVQILNATQFVLIMHKPEHSVHGAHLALNS